MSGLYRTTVGLPDLPVGQQHARGPGRFAGNDVGVGDNEVRGDRPTAPFLDPVAGLPLDLDRRGRDEADDRTFQRVQERGLAHVLSGHDHVEDLREPVFTDEAPESLEGVGRAQPVIVGLVADPARYDGMGRELGYPRGR
jgi:hypothetical protein